MAILHEGDEPGVVTEITYEDLLRQVCRVANAMLELGVKKGDFVTLYMPMVPEAAVAMLACARLGAPHSVVFAGFSAEALRDRVVVSLRRVRCDNRSDCLALVPELSTGRSAALLILAEPRPRLSLALDVAEPTLACLGSPELS